MVLERTSVTLQVLDLVGSYLIWSCILKLKDLTGEAWIISAFGSRVALVNVIAPTEPLDVGQFSIAEMDVGYFMCLSMSWISLKEVLGKSQSRAKAHNDESFEHLAFL